MTRKGNRNMYLTFHGLSYGYTITVGVIPVTMAHWGATTLMLYILLHIINYNVSHTTQSVNAT